MYSLSAAVYDAVYSSKDYPAEAGILARMIEERAPRARTLLDVACGTGKHLAELRRSFDVDGLEIEPEFVSIARARLPGVRIHEGDMTDFDLGRRFDVVTNLFSAIAYVRSADRLRTAVGTMARHLEPGGLLVVEPFIHRDDWIPGGVYSVFVDELDLKVARVNISPPPEPDGTVVLEMHHVVGRPGGVETFVERHVLALFGRDEYMDALHAAGLEPGHDPEGLTGRGLFFGRRGP